MKSVLSNTLIALSLACLTAAPAGAQGATEVTQLAYTVHPELEPFMPEGWRGWSESESLLCDNRLAVVQRIGHTPTGSKELQLYIVNGVVVVYSFDADTSDPAIRRVGVYNGEVVDQTDELELDSEHPLVLASIQNAGIQNVEAAFGSCLEALIEELPSMDEIISGFRELADQVVKDAEATVDRLKEFTK